MSEARVVPIAVVDGVRLAYHIGGTGQPVVFVHGGFASLGSSLSGPEYRAWGGWENEFAQRCEFLTYDRRGCFASSCPPDGYGIEDQAGDLDGLLDALGIGVVDVIGSSAGGPIAMAFAATRPPRVRRLVLVGTAVDLWRPIPGDTVLPLIAEMLAVLDEAGPAASMALRPPGAEADLQRLYMTEEYDERGELVVFAAREDDRARRARKLPIDTRLAYHVAELRNLQAYIEHDARDFARSVRAPTLVLHGARDRAVPLEWARELPELIPNAHLQVVEDRSHSLLQRSPEARQAVITFLTEEQ